MKSIKFRDVRPLPNLIALSLFGASVAAALGIQAAENQSASPLVVRCAVIGGLVDTGIWEELAERYKLHSRNSIALVASGPKHVIAGALVDGDADLVTMHVGDPIVNLVADGHAENLQPWLRSDLVLIGPADDPAGVRGEKDVAAALRKIIAAKGKFLGHRSQGASEVLAEILAQSGLEIPAAQLISAPHERHRQMLKLAEEEQAYTLIGRIPFLAGKVDGDGLIVMVEGDTRLRRPYLVATATDNANPQRRQAAIEFAAFLRSAETQAFIADYGRERYDGKPLFFPVAVPSSK